MYNICSYYICSYISNSKPPLSEGQSLVSAPFFPVFLRCFFGFPTSSFFPESIAKGSSARSSRTNLHRVGIESLAESQIHRAKCMEPSA